MTGVCGSEGRGNPRPEPGTRGEEAGRLETELGSQTQRAEIPAQLLLTGA